MKRPNNPPTAGSDLPALNPPSPDMSRRTPPPAAVTSPIGATRSPVAETVPARAATPGVDGTEIAAAAHRASAVDAAVAGTSVTHRTDSVRISAPASEAWQPDDPLTYLFRPADEPSFHSATASFPIVESHVERLTDNIKSDGLAEPVLVLVSEDGVENILDGRHRILACKKAGRPCAYRKTRTLPDGESPVAYVLRKFRQSSIARAMTRVDLAFLAARFVDNLTPSDDDRPTTGSKDPSKKQGSSYLKAAREIGYDLKVNTVRNAHDVLKNCPALEGLVKARKVVLSTAATIANLDDGNQRNRAINAIHAGGDKATLRAIVKGKPADEVLADQLRWDERAKQLFAEWDRHEKSLAAFRVWLDTLRGDDAENASLIGRVLIGAIKLSDVDQLVEAMQQSKPAVRCSWCESHSSSCAACSNSGWLTKHEKNRHAGAATEAYRDKLTKAKARSKSR